MGSGYGLGIDIGTTFTGAAVGYPGDRPRPVQLGTNGFAIPSVIFVKPDGDFLVGDAAERAASGDPTRVGRHFKRRFGDDTPMVLGGTPIDATTLTAAILRSVVTSVTDRNGNPPEAITLTHPANWGAFRLEMLEKLTADLGTPVRLLSEPEAAGVEYQAAERVEDGSLIGVYDLGGGTFDAVVLRKGGDGFGIAGKAEGIERLGGVDFDAAIVGFVADQLPPDSFDDESAERFGHELRRSSIEAKLQLSEDTVANIALPGGVGGVRLTRSEFEERIRPLVVETIRVFGRALQQAGIGPDELDRILLVGGSSRVPLVGLMLHREFGRPVFVDTDPTMTVALGAARDASSGLVAEPRDASRPPARLRPTPTFTELAPQEEPPPLPEPVHPESQTVEPSGLETVAPSPPRQPQPAHAQPIAAPSHPLPATPAPPSQPLVEPPPSAPATQPSAPATQPSAPAAQPSAPATQPSAPAAQPSAPATQPQPGAVPPPSAPGETASPGSSLDGIASQSPLRERRTPVKHIQNPAPPVTSSELQPVKSANHVPLIAAVVVTAVVVVLLTQLLN